MRILIYHTKQCDPKICTSLKLKKFGLAQVFYTLKRIPRNSIVLDPFAETVISREDMKYLEPGIVGLDCSWKKALEVFKKLRIPYKGRALPLLVAGNPVNYGKIGKLTTAEALASALYIMGYQEEGERLLSKFKWGPAFLDLNRGLLDSYSNAKNEKEVLELQKEWIDIWQDSQKRKKGCSM